MAFVRSILAAFLFSFLVSTSISANDPLGAYDVPHLKRISVDGDLDDWGDRGFIVGNLTDYTYDWLVERTDYHVEMRVGWNKKGLVVACIVTDSTPFESSNLKELWRNDAVQVFLAPQVGSSVSHTALVTPGRTFEDKKPRCHMQDFSEAEGFTDRDSPNITFASRHHSGGYSLEMLLPWDDLDIRPRKGVTVAMQAIVTDGYGEKDPRAAFWFPSRLTYRDMRKMNPIRLAGSSEMSVVTNSWLHHSLDGRAKITVEAPARFTGKKVRYTYKKTVLGEVTLQEQGIRSYGELPLPVDTRIHSYDSVVAEIPGISREYMTHGAETFALANQTPGFVRDPDNSDVFSYYLLHKPSNYADTGRTYPLLLYLHGAGRVGHGLVLLSPATVDAYMPKTVSDSFFVVSPQCPPAEYGFSGERQKKSLDYLLETINSRYPVDTSRIYLMGVSMGAYAASEYAVSNPNRFAAACLIAGGHHENICELRNVPLCIVHGERDNQVSVEEARKSKAVMDSCGGSVELIIHPKAGHDAGAEIVKPRIYKWMLTQGKKNALVVESDR